MDVITLETARKMLQDRRLLVVARLTGLHYNTLIRIRDGRTKSARRRVLERLTAYLLHQEGRSDEQLV